MEASVQEVRKGRAASRKDNWRTRLEKREGICENGPYTLQDGQKTKRKCMEKAIRKKKVVGSNGRFTMDLKWLRKDGMGTFSEILRNMVGEQWENWVDDNVWLEFLKFGYVQGWYVPDLKDQDREGGLIRERERYVRRVQRVFEIKKFGAGEF